MTKKGPRKSVDPNFWQGRLTQGKAYRQAARDAATLAQPGDSGNPIISNTVLAAIAFCDALTAKLALIVNQSDHAAAPNLLREVLQKELPDAQQTSLRRIIGYKDAVQYGAKAYTVADAQKALDRLETFSVWVEDRL